MNELRKAKIYSSEIEKNYTCLIGLRVLKDNDSTDFVSSFGGKKFRLEEDYNIWKNGIENIVGRRFEDINGAYIKVVISDNEDDAILGIGSLKGNNWITKNIEIIKEDGRNKPKVTYSFLNTKKEINEFFKSVGIEEQLIETEEIVK